MSAWRYALTGSLALALVDAAVSSNAAATRAGGMFTSLAGVIEHVLSPTVAAIPDLRKHGGAAALQSAPQQAAPVGTLVPPDWTTSPTVAQMLT